MTAIVPQCKIEALARQLQALPGEIRWAHIEQSTIVAVATGVPATNGPWTTRIRLFLRFAAAVRLDLAVTKLISLILLVTIRCRRSQIAATSQRGCIFVGIAALREAELVRQFEAMTGEPATVFDQRLVGALDSIGPPTIWEMLRSWRDAARPIFCYLASEERDKALDRSSVLNFLVRCLHQYAHLLAVFRGLHASSPGTSVAFSNAGLPAYAAIQTGIEAIYFPHGFLGRSLVLPDFRRVIAFNAPEAEHVQARLPGASVSWVPPIIRPLRASRRLAVVGDYGDKLARSRELIEFCREARINVVVRPHPADRSGYWTEWEAVSGVSIDRGGTFDEFLERYCPAVMATWYSTTIFDALLRGVVPISFEADKPDIVFPLSEVVLKWPQQKDRILLVLADATARREMLANALSRAIGPLYVNSTMKRFEALALNSEMPA
jgi:hypothetical protein